jgi:hypothetical protein
MNLTDEELALEFEELRILGEQQSESWLWQLATRARLFADSPVDRWCVIFQQTNERLWTTCVHEAGHGAGFLAAGDSIRAVSAIGGTRYGGRVLRRTCNPRASEQLILNGHLAGPVAAQELVGAPFVMSVEDLGNNATGDGILAARTLGIHPAELRSHPKYFDGLAFARRFVAEWAHVIKMIAAQLFNYRVLSGRAVDIIADVAGVKRC